MLVPYLLGVAAAGSTYAGGRLAMRLGRRQDLLFGLTGGMVVGLALLDLLPEAVEGGGSASEWVFGAVAIGMALYILLHRLPGGAMVGRVSLVLHSLMDGLGIGFAFQVSQSTGWLVAAAVLAHDMADGANMIGISSTACRPERAHRWLIANAAAPLAGVAIGQAIRIDAHHLSLLLALFAGGFLYIGASELLPRSRGGARGYGAGLASMAGIGVMACVTYAAG
ncbi:ZIP family metal transporter [uncultured Sphingomonas sp.]|uniref:ZIP family metal transporter n=1 Tax=uncultured Sphingomonas sp. TaxID=158754 RepID=UPI0025EBA3F2|nr:ZIP family metal transporter [uncultured Sphingomonas sp.]